MSTRDESSDESEPSVEAGTDPLGDYPIDTDYLALPSEGSSTISETYDLMELPLAPWEFTEVHLDPQRAATIDIDENRTRHGNGFPRDDRTVKAATTFFENDIEDPSKAPSWELHHGLDCYDFADDREHGLRVDPDVRDKAIRLDCLLSVIEWPRQSKKRAITRALNTDLRRFNAHYGGIDGAAWGFAFLTAFPDMESAIDSDIASSSAFEDFCRREDIDGPTLIKRMFDWYD